MLIYWLSPSRFSLLRSLSLCVIVGPWMFLYRHYTSNLSCLISNSLKSRNVYRSRSHVAAQQDQISCNLLAGNLLGKHKASMEIKQESHAQLSSLANLCFSCAMSLPWTTPCWLLTLWLPLLAIPPLHSACSYNPICATWNFTLVVWSVMVLWVATNGAAMKPRAFYGAWHKVVLLRTCWYWGF